MRRKNGVPSNAVPNNAKYISVNFMDSTTKYTYYHTYNTIKVGDFVLVETNKPTDRILSGIGAGRPLNVISAVHVVEVDVEPKEHILYKPIIQKIDFKNYLTLTGEID